MKIKNVILCGLVATLSFGNLAVANSADNEKEFIKAFGMVIYQNLSQNAGLGDLKFTDAELETFFQGMREFAKDGKFPENINEMGPQMMEYLRKRAESNVQKEGEKNEAVAVEYWKELDKNANMKKSPTGLYYEIINPGSAVVPSENSSVVVKYTGSLIDGTVFDATDRHPQKQAEFVLDQVIPGFREGLQKVGKGGKIKLYIPAKLAYGNNPPSSTIPVNAALIFEVEILDVKNFSEATESLPKEQTAEK